MGAMTRHRSATVSYSSTKSVIARSMTLPKLGELNPPITYSLPATAAAVTSVRFVGAGAAVRHDPASSTAAQRSPPARCGPDGGSKLVQNKREDNRMTAVGPKRGAAGAGRPHRRMRLQRRMRGIIQKADDLHQPRAGARDRRAWRRPDQLKRRRATAYNPASVAVNRFSTISSRPRCWRKF